MISSAWSGKTAAGISYCSFGELLQGVLPDGDVDFLVTLPIQKYSIGYFVPDVHSTEIVVYPQVKTKAAALAKRIIQHYGCTLGGALYIECDALSGKGLSSSSADMLAAARAIETYMGIELPLTELCWQMSDIEPTDGLMYAESVVYLQRKGVLWATLGRLPEMQIVSLDEGGTMDTLEYHRTGVAREHDRQHRREYGTLLTRMTDAFARRDVAEIGTVSTRSAYINQQINPKRHLEAVHAVCRQTQGVGLVTAHSGTCIGILYDATLSRHAACVDAAINALSTYGQVHVYDTIK